jgi:hypothetical protein
VAAKAAATYGGKVKAGAAGTTAQAAAVYANGVKVGGMGATAQAAATYAGMVKMGAAGATSRAAATYADKIKAGKYKQVGICISSQMSALIFFSRILGQRVHRHLKEHKALLFDRLVPLNHRKTLYMPSLPKLSTGSRILPNIPPLLPLAARVPSRTRHLQVVAQSLPSSAFRGQTVVLPSHPSSKKHSQRRALLRVRVRALKSRRIESRRI